MTDIGGTQAFKLLAFHATQLRARTDQLPFRTSSGGRTSTELLVSTHGRRTPSRSDLPNADKCTGLRWLCDHLGVAAADVIAVGDEWNDVTMLEWAGRGIAMGNAADRVKAVADEVIGSHRDGRRRGVFIESLARRLILMRPDSSVGDRSRIVKTSARLPLHNHAGSYTPHVAGNTSVVVNALIDNVDQVIRGKRAEIRLALCCLLTEGHLLLDDVPGTGKTSSPKAIANSIAGGWKRVQFTPDLLPTDITGVMVYDQRSGQFNFREGPVFTNVMIGDEINRGSPKTQSALLEVMEERNVTSDGTTRPVAAPVLRDRHAEPSRLPGNVPAPRRPARPVLDATHPSAMRTPTPSSRSSRTSTRVQARPTNSNRSPTPSNSTGSSPRSTASPSRIRCTSTSWNSQRRPVGTPTCASACRRVAPCRCCASRERSPRRTTAIS